VKLQGCLAIFWRCVIRLGLADEVANHLCVFVGLELEKTIKKLLEPNMTLTEQLFFV
jgi:hypothetical protein